MSAQETCAFIAPSIVCGTQQIVIPRDLAFPPSELCAWGGNGLIAYALALHEQHHTVSIIDAHSMQLVQTLNGHASPIVALAWPPLKTSQFDQNSVNLLVADRGGVVGFWDVAEGCVQRMVRLPEGEVARSLTFVGASAQQQGSTDEQLVVICESGNGIVLDMMLRSPSFKPFAPFANQPPSHSMAKSRLADVCAVVHETSVRVYKNLDRGEGASFFSEIAANTSDDSDQRGSAPQQHQQRYSATKLELDAPDATCFVDACFSAANSEVIFVASPTSIIAVDWSLSLTLNTQLLWLSSPGVTFQRIFTSFPSQLMPAQSNTTWAAAWQGQERCSSSSSSASSSSDVEDVSDSADDTSSTYSDASSSWRYGSDDDGGSTASSSSTDLDLDEVAFQDTVPVLYSFTSDLKLTAWAISDLDTIRAHAVDVRGARLTTKHVLTVSQNETDTTRFAVVFTDGSVVHWRFLTHSLTWSMCGYYEACIYKPVAMAAIGTTAICVALEGGSLVVHDVHLGRTMRRAHVVKAGSTRITSLVPLSPDSPAPAVSSPSLMGCGGGSGSWGHVLVGTTRTERHGTILQVSIVNLDTMAVVGTLRRGAPLSRKGQEGAGGGSQGASQQLGNAMSTDPAPFKDMRLDASERYLLISFENNAFEVWNLETESLIHIHSNPNNGAFWGLPAVSLCKVKRSYADNASLKNNYQQLVGVTVGEGIYYYLPVGDKLLKVQELFGLRMSSMSATLVQCCVVEEKFVAFDSVAGGTVTKGIGLADGAWGTLKDVPPKTQAVHVCPCPPQCRAPFIPSGKNAGANGYTVYLDTALVATVFDDGTFGVWNVRLRERVGYSGATKGQLGVNALRTAWLANEHLAVLTARGSIAIVSSTCDTLNAHVYNRSLASPMTSPAFLFVTHAFHLKSELELTPVRHTLDEMLNAMERNKRIDAVKGPANNNSVSHPSRLSRSSVTAPSASYIVRNVPATLQLPYRNAFGQLVTMPRAQRRMTLEDELQMHVRHMPPSWLVGVLMKAARASRRGLQGAEVTLAVAAFAVSNFMGLEGRQELWELAVQCRNGWRPAGDRDATFMNSDSMHHGSFSPSATAAFDPPFSNSFVDGRTARSSNRSPIYASPLEEQAERCEAQQAIVDVVDVLCPSPYSCPSRLSEALADTQAVRRNKGSLNIQRMHALHLMPFKGIDDSAARLHVARDLINMSELGKAGEVLLETSFDAPSFAFHAQLAINVAAATQPRPLPTPLVLACKRAGAMLLAKGDVEGAVEKFALIGEHHEACMALQATGRWMEAAVQARISPSLSLPAKLELLHRWVKHRAQRKEIMPATKLLLRLGAPRTAMALLNESPHAADASGLFCLFLLLGSFLTSRSHLNDPIVSPSRTDDCGHHQGSSSTSSSSNKIFTLRDVICQVLGDYISLLQSTSNAAMARRMQRLRSAFLLKA